MKKLDILFRNNTNRQLQTLVDEIVFDKSKIARAAMQYGIKALIEADRQKAINIVGIGMIRDVLEDK